MRSNTTPRPVLFGIALQYFGPNVVVPFYFFLLYVQTPIESFRAADSRLTDVAYTSTAGPLIILLGLMPKSFYFYHDSSWAHTDPIWHWMAKLQPLTISFAQALLGRTLIRSSVRQDRLWANRRDVPWIRGSIGLLVAASTTAWIWTLAHNLSTTHLANANLSWDQITLVFGGCIWLALAWGDLRKAGMVHSGWVKAVISSLASLVCFGPGGMLAAGWLAREEILLQRRHRSAITRPG